MRGLVLLVLAVVAASATTSCSLFCGANGYCVPQRRVARLDYSTGVRKLLVSDAADYCQCKDGYWGDVCQFSCPGMTPPFAETACGGGDRHVSPPNRPETCGQVVHPIPSRDEAAFLATYNEWAAPGYCNCRRPYFGSACQWKAFTNTSLTLLPSWTDFVTERVRLLDLRTGALEPRSPPAAAVCSRDAAVRATAEGCLCPAGSLVDTVAQQAAASSNVLWPFSQVPLCLPAISAPRSQTTSSPPPPVVVVPPPPPVSSSSPTPYRPHQRFYPRHSAEAVTRAPYGWRDAWPSSPSSLSTGGIITLMVLVIVLFLIGIAILFIKT
jgi:hypothetical protein